MARLLMLIGLLVALAVLLGALGLGRRRQSAPFDLADRLGWAPAQPRTKALPGAHLPRVTAQGVMAAAAGASAGYLAGYQITGDSLLAAAFAVGGAIALPQAWRGWQAGRRRRLLLLQLETALSHLATALRANASILQALQQVAVDTPAPLGEELLLSVDLLRAGHTLEYALARVRERVGLADFTLVAVSTEISAEVGSNLAATYDRVVETLRERRNFRGAVEALTAQGRYGAAMVTVMPFLLIAVMRAANPTYLEPLLETTPGRILMVVCGTLIGFGWMVISRIVNIRLD